MSDKPVSTTTPTTIPPSTIVICDKKRRRNRNRRNSRKRFCSLHLEKILGEVHFLKTDKCELTTNVATKPIFAIVRAAAAATFAENYSEIAEFDEIDEFSLCFLPRTNN